MSETKEFKMSKEDHKKILEASKPVSAIDGEKKLPSSQANANRIWEELGKKMGFKPFTAKPIDGKSNRHFSAETTDDEHI